MGEAKAEMTIALERASTKLAEQKSSSECREEELTSRCSRLARKVEEIQVGNI